MKPIVIRETSGRTLTALRNGIKLFTMHKSQHKAFYRRVHELEAIIRRASAAAQARVNEFLAMMRLMYICRALARLVAPQPLIVAEILPAESRLDLLKDKALAIQRHTDQIKEDDRKVSEKYNQWFEAGMPVEHATCPYRLLKG